MNVVFSIAAVQEARAAKEAATSKKRGEKRDARRSELDCATAECGFQISLHYLKFREKRFSYSAGSVRKWVLVIPPKVNTVRRALCSYESYTNTSTILFTEHDDEEKKGNPRQK